MTILITGGTGKTGVNIAKLLNESGRDVLLTSRKGVAPAPFKAVKFDWLDKDTFENPFAADSNIERVYLVDEHGQCLAGKRAVVVGVIGVVLLCVLIPIGGPYLQCKPSTHVQYQ